MEQPLMRHDIRAPSIDNCRRKAHIARWANGVVHAANLENCTDHTDHVGCSPYINRGMAEGCRKPQHELSQVRMAAIKRQEREGSSRLGRQNRQAGRDDVEEGKAMAISADDPGRDEVSDFAPDDGVMYSFDASSGPQLGHRIFEVALTTAVHTFEHKQTDKLIRNEYEVVAPEPDAASPLPLRCRKAVVRPDDDLADFELL
ncbi:MAG: hypothetical protein M1826_004769 [Phylliscum demangeonii]|nr:MAG: hypothetical protein M1826_004769 [Phylliscum demangeonii]